VLEQRHEGVREHLVRAVADEDLFRAHAVVPGERGLERVGVGVGVEAQAVAGGGADGLQHLRRGAAGVLVGVELDEVVELGLFARHVGGQAVDDGAPEAAHAGVCG
jgi:hypothetical protein